jgi:hypothetical protein
LSNSPAAFRHNVEEFNDYLSFLFTRTITDHPLRPIIRPRVAYISFEGARRFGDSPSIELKNGLQIRVSQTVISNPEDPEKITTARYSYSYALGSSGRTDWLLRYDYRPDVPARNPGFRHPVAHVHFNGTSDAYAEFVDVEEKPLKDLHCPTDRITVEDFIEHLIIEFDTPTHHGKNAALALLDERRREFHQRLRTRRAPYNSP